jgi:hypothetical protein
MVEMKKTTVFVLSSLILCLSFFILSTSTYELAYAEPTVGVKEGDWMEYDIAVSGTGSLPPTHDVRWMRMDVLEVDGTTFSVNFTVKYANGTMGSAVWKFDFVEGNTEGWTIIPANRGVGDTFFDYTKPDRVIVQGEAQRTVLGASRVVTYGSDEIRHHKEWDKTTGFFISSVEAAKNYTNPAGWYFDDLTMTIKATATNMWGRQIWGFEQSIFALVISGLVLAVTALISILIVWQGKKLSNFSISGSQRVKIVVAAVVIVGVVVFVATVVPAVLMGMWLSNAQVNMIMQSLWLSLIVVSICFRKIGNYSVHGLVMVAVIVATLIGFASVLMMWSPADSSSMGGYFSAPLKIAEFVAHGVLSIPALALGAWFVVLWRPNSAVFPVKSRKVLKIMVILWVLSYLAGLVGYMLDYTTLSG